MVTYALQMEESSLQYSLDFKFLFDCLAERNGRIKLDTLAVHWPGNDRLVATEIPKDCIEYWRASSAQDGSLTWKGFSKGLQGAFKGDSTTSKAMNGSATVLITTQEMEEKLLKCTKAQLTEGLTRTRKEMYKYQKSINALTSPRKGLFKL